MQREEIQASDSSLQCAQQCARKWLVSTRLAVSAYRPALFPVEFHPYTVHTVYSTLTRTGLDNVR